MATAIKAKPRPSQIPLVTTFDELSRRFKIAPLHSETAADSGEA
jgi:hypothetical protein